MDESTLLEAVRYAKPVVIRALREHTSHAEDILQTAALKALSATSRGSGFEGRNRAAFNSWFTSICIREILQLIRKRHSDRQDRTTDLEGVEIRLTCSKPNPEQLAIRAQRRRVLAEELVRLSPLCRREMLLVSAGEVIGRNETRKARVFRARWEMRRRLEARKDFAR